MVWYSIDGWGGRELEVGAEGGLTARQLFAFSSVGFADVLPVLGGELILILVVLPTLRRDFQNQTTNNS